jgi:EmrB/QacA subfamily drug resistance transporter
MALATSSGWLRSGNAQDQETITRRRWLILPVLCLSLMIVVVGNTVLNVALPTLVRRLNATTTELQWIVDGYSLVFAGLLLTAGSLGDRYGRKGALQFGLIAFGTASGLAAFATSGSQLVAARAVMGASAAFIMPATLSILTNVFPPQERARAIAIWAGVAGAGAAIGPVASGWLLVHYWWGSIFLVNLPVVVFALIAGWFLLPTSRDPQHAPLDLVGAVLSMLGLASLLYAIIEAPTKGWTADSIVAAFALAAVLLGSFAWWELHRTDPMLDLRYFRKPSFRGGTLAISLVFFVMFGIFFLSTQYFQVVLGYSALGAGVRLLPMALTMMVVAPLSARVAERIGTKSVAALGLTLVAVGVAILSRVGVSTGYGMILAALVVMAAGMAFTMAPSTAAIMSSMPLRKAGVGSAVNDTTRELGGALGVAVLGSLVASRYTSRLKPALSHFPAAVKVHALGSVGGAVDASARIGGRAGAALAASARLAFVSGLRSTLLIGSAVAVVAAVLVYRNIPDRLVQPDEIITEAAAPEAAPPEQVRGVGADADVPALSPAD